MRRFRTYHEIEEPAGADVPDQVAAQAARLADRLAGVGAVWLVASGKGGVGKSAVAANLAAGLAAAGHAVGALDADLNGPSLGRMLGADRSSLVVGDAGVRPASGVAGTRVMSTDLLLSDDDAPLRWREPGSHGFLWQSTLETGTLREFLSDVEWGVLDVLVLDLPPGTDKLARTLDLVRPAGVLLVTTPSEAARAVVARSLRLVREAGVERVGLVANMTGHVCERCGHHEPLYDADGAAALARDSGVEIWADVPFETAFARATDSGRPPTLDPDAPAAGRAIRGLAARVAAESGLTLTTAELP